MRRHRFDPWSLVPGLVFAAFALVVLVSDIDVTDWNFSWAAPAVFILAGLALLFGSRQRASEESGHDDDALEGPPKA